MKLDCACPPPEPIRVRAKDLPKGTVFKIDGVVYLVIYYGDTAVHFFIDLTNSLELKGQEAWALSERKDYVLYPDATLVCGSPKS